MQGLEVSDGNASRLRNNLIEEKPRVNMIRMMFARPLLALTVSLATVISQSAEAQENILTEKLPSTAAIAQNPGISLKPQPDALLPNPASSSKEIQSNAMLPNPPISVREIAPCADQSEASTGVPPESQEPTEQRPKTMLSISCYGQYKTEASQHLLIHCRTQGGVSNAGENRILLKGVVTEDVVSGGKILIAAGSRVAGIGRVDPDSGRFESKGNWSIIVENHELRVEAELQDADGGFHGIAGKETSFESELSQRQAVVRDGRYCFVVDKTPFVLSLTGKVDIAELKALGSLQ